MNRGYGYSIKKGVSIAKNKVVGIIDCDNSYVIDDLIINLKNFRSKNINVLVGKEKFEYDEGFLKKNVQKVYKFFFIANF